MTTLNRLRGLRALLEDVVEHGASAVERVHMATAARPFEIVALIAPIAPGARAVRILHDAAVAGVYGTIRHVNRLVGATLSVALDVVELRANAGHLEPTVQVHDDSTRHFPDLPPRS
jgi:hypothetical protein